MSAPAAPPAQQGGTMALDIDGQKFNVNWGGSKPPTQADADDIANTIRKQQGFAMPTNNPKDSGNWRRLYNFAVVNGFQPSRDHNGMNNGFATGGHNPGSWHYSGDAQDISVTGKSQEDIQGFIQAAQQAGYHVLPELTRPAGRAWSAPHLHLSYRAGENVSLPSADSGDAQAPPQPVPSSMQGAVGGATLGAMLNAKPAKANPKQYSRPAGPKNTSPVAGTGIQGTDLDKYFGTPLSGGGAPTGTKGYVYNPAGLFKSGQGQVPTPEEAFQNAKSQAPPGGLLGHGESNIGGDGSNAGRSLKNQRMLTVPQQAAEIATHRQFERNKAEWTQAVQSTPGIAQLGNVNDWITKQAQNAVPGGNTPVGRPIVSTVAGLLNPLQWLHGAITTVLDPAGSVEGFARPFRAFDNWSTATPEEKSQAWSSLAALPAMLLIAHHAPPMIRAAIAKAKAGDIPGAVALTDNLPSVQSEVPRPLKPSPVSETAPNLQPPSMQMAYDEVAHHVRNGNPIIPFADAAKKYGVPLDELKRHFVNDPHNGWQIRQEPSGQALSEPLAGQAYYHGHREQIGKFEATDASDYSTHLFGEGIYFTDDAGVANKYAKVGTSRVGISPDAKLVSADKPTPPEILREWEKTFGAEPGSFKPGKNFGSDWKDIESDYAGMTGDSLAEVKADLSNGVIKAGYDGITHKANARGGWRTTGNGATNNVVILYKTDRISPYEPKTPGTAPSAPANNVSRETIPSDTGRVDARGKPIIRVAAASIEVDPTPEPTVNGKTPQTATSTSEQATGIANRIQDAEDTFYRSTGNKKGVAHDEGKAVADGMTDAQLLDYSKNVASGKVDGTGETFAQALGVMLEAKRRFLVNIDKIGAQLDKNPGDPELVAQRDAARNDLDTLLTNTQQGKGGWSDAGRAMQEGTNVNTGSFEDVMAEIRRVKDPDKPVNPKLEAQVKDLTGKLADRDAKISELQAGGTVDDLVSRFSREKVARTSEELKNERQDLFAELRKTTAKVGATPFDPDLAKVLTKLTINLVRSGVNTLEGVVGEIMRAVPNLTRRQITDHLSGYGAPLGKAASANRQAYLNIVKQAGYEGKIADVNAGKPVQVTPKRNYDNAATKAKQEEFKQAKLTGRIKELQTAIQSGKLSDLEATRQPKAVIQQSKAVENLIRQRDALDQHIKGLIEKQKNHSVLGEVYKGIGGAFRGYVLSPAHIITHIALSGPSHLALQELARLPQSAINFYRGARGQAIVRQGFSPVDFASSLVRGVGRGIAEAKSTEVTGRNSVQRAIGTTLSDFYGSDDLKTILKNPAKYEQLVTRQHAVAMGVTSYFPAFYRALKEDAHLAVSQLPESTLQSLDSSLSGLTGGKLRSAAKNYLVHHPSEAMTVRANEEAVRNSYMQPNRLITWIRQADRTVGGPAGTATRGAVEGARKAIMPVITPSTNAPIMASDYTPIGLGRSVIGKESLFKDLPPEARARSEALASKGLTGMALITAGYYLYKHGQITADYQQGKDSQTYKTGQEASKKHPVLNTLGVKVKGMPESINIGKFSIPMRYAGIVGVPLVMGANMARSQHQNVPAWKSIPATAWNHLNPLSPVFSGGERMKKATDNLQKPPAVAR